MFGFSHLPFSTIQTVFYNGEEFGFILNVEINKEIPLNIDKQISFVLNIEKDRVIIL